MTDITLRLPPGQMAALRCGKSESAAGDGDAIALRANRARSGGEIPHAGFDGLREAEQRSGVGGGDGTPIGARNGNFRGSDVLWKFGNGKSIITAGGEKCGVDAAAEFFDGSADYGETVV